MPSRKKAREIPPKRCRTTFVLKKRLKTCQDVMDERAARGDPPHMLLSALFTHHSIWDLRNPSPATRMTVAMCQYDRACLSLREKQIRDNVLGDLVDEEAENERRAAENLLRLCDTAQ